MPKLKTLQIETQNPIACKRAIKHYGFEVVSENSLGGVTIINTNIRNMDDAYKVAVLHTRVALANGVEESPVPELFDPSGEREAKLNVKADKK